ncbi:MAG: hypothetical protein JJU29_23390, partial [Verrucomicrobia bacterium]|nr:hypothetical protein [Verrucomicrobiota bacterium]
MKSFNRVAFKAAALEMFKDVNVSSESGIQPDEFTWVKEGEKIYLMIEAHGKLLDVYTPDERGNPEFTDYIPVQRRSKELFEERAKHLYASTMSGLWVPEDKITWVEEGMTKCLVFENNARLLAVFISDETGNPEFTDYIPVAYRGDEDFKTKAERLYFEGSDEGGSVCQPGEITQVEE